MTDEQRSVSKSRMPWEESRRLDKRSSEEKGNEESKNEWNAPLSASTSSKGAKDGNKRAVQEVYDHEVYDDRMFYAMLLKVGDTVHSISVIHVGNVHCDRTVQKI